MAKITFMGAGSTVFAKNVLGDCMVTPALRDSHIALYDIDGTRLRESKAMLATLNKNMNKGRCKITSHLGVKERKKALKDADYVINAIQVGGYKPSTVIDFEIPAKYGLKQTIADTLGIGGIFRTLRTAPVMMDFARDMEKVCPDAWFLNYTNPMSMLTGALLRGTDIKTVGLCHSVQVVGESLLSVFGKNPKYLGKIKTKVAGINHMGWLLEITSDGKDIYPEIKKKAKALLAKERKKKATLIPGQNKDKSKYTDLVRLEMMMQFGYYVTESSEHNAEYHPYFIKDKYPELIEQYNIPIDEYPRRCVAQIAGWKKQKKELVGNKKLRHKRTHEYGSFIIEAMETGVPTQIGGNVMNTGLITNLPHNCVVEVPCLVDHNGIQGCHVGDLPEVCAALNRTSINVQQLTLEAVLKGKRDAIYQAAMLDPHTNSELSIDEIRKMCDEMIKAHGKMLPKYK
ncbi:MAG: alpha-galactosidase [Planctomycetota bacterium]|jgi:alpha-galactosidase